MLKECPNCHELVGENADDCFNCKYDFKLKRVKTTEERKVELQEKEQKVREEKEKEEKLELQRMKQERELLQEHNSNINKNALYEYRVELIPDLSSGQMDYVKINNVLNTYAKNRWRLHTIITNEVGKVSRVAGVGGFSTGVNATIDTTMMIFERCLEPNEF